jgi:hypothetical protein
MFRKCKKKSRLIGGYSALLRSWLGLGLSYRSDVRCQPLTAQRVAFGPTRPQFEYNERASEEARPGDVGDQALMRGLDTA